MYHEPFTRAHALAFACIWTALAVLWWDLRRRLGSTPLTAGVAYPSGR